jgi:hypothetical protein
MTKHILFAFLLMAACSDKKDDKGKAEKPAAAEPAAPAAKASKAECEKVVANQLALEKDPSMKSAMEMSKDGLMSGCLDMTSTQAQCAAAATSNDAFATCILSK